MFKPRTLLSKRSNSVVIMTHEILYIFSTLKNDSMNTVTPLTGSSDVVRNIFIYYILHYIAYTGTKCISKETENSFEES